jgi:hypothetical protein
VAVTSTATAASSTKKRHQGDQSCPPIDITAHELPTLALPLTFNAKATDQDGSPVDPG